MIFIGIILVIIFAALLTYENTRKLALKILLNFFILLLTYAITGFIEYKLFKDTDMFFCVFGFTIFDVFLLQPVILSTKYLLETIRLYKYGIHTTGTVTKHIGGRGNGYEVRYYVDDKEYKCVKNSLTQEIKFQCNDEITVFYLKDKPEKSCAKGELSSAIIIAAAMFILVVGSIIAECYIFSAFF